MANLYLQIVKDVTSGTVVIMNNGQDVQVVHDAGLTLNLSFTFPANPVDNQRVSIASVGGIGVLNLSAGLIPILNPITALAAGVTGSYLYSSQYAKWYKVRN